MAKTEHGKKIVPVKPYKGAANLAEQKLRPLLVIAIAATDLDDKGAMRVPGVTRPFTCHPGLRHPRGPAGSDARRLLKNRSLGHQNALAGAIRRPRSRT